MTILTFNWHEAYICLLAKTGVSIDIVERNKGGSDIWFYETRPVPRNARIVSQAEARLRLRAGAYDTVVCHTVLDLLWTAEWPVPKILVFHSSLSTETALSQDTVGRERRRAEVADRIARTPDVRVVFVSESKRSDWGFDGEVISPGIDLNDYSGYRGGEERVLRVGNFMRMRDAMGRGFTLQQQVLDGLPSTLLGLNEGEVDARFSRSWGDLRHCYQNHRCYLHTTVQPYEDGYNLAMLEAMATGMPVVSLANPSSPLRDGIDGFVGANADELRERVERLLTDWDLARRLGASGRERVAERFPLGGFVERWKQVLEASTARPAASVSSAGNCQASISPTKRRLRVLLAYNGHPATPARYFETSLRRRHEVVTAGPVTGQETLRNLNLQAMREPVRPHDIPCNGDVDIERVVRTLGTCWKPDLFLWIESVPGSRPRNVPHLDCPTAAYLIDSDSELSTHLDWAPRFDWVFVAQRAYVEMFRAAGCPRVSWLPLACDPAMHGRARVKTRYDIGCVGSLTSPHPARQSRLDRLGQRFEVHVERSFLRDAARTMSASRIVFNDTSRNELNMRVFEALASGSMLLTDSAPGSGLDQMFLDREHLVIYEDATLEELADHYLRHPDEREAIAARGREEVLRWHTYDHRVESLIDTIYTEDTWGEDDPTAPLVVTDALLKDSLQLFTERRFEAALSGLLKVSDHRVLVPRERAVCHAAVAACFRHVGNGDAAVQRELAALRVLTPDQAAATLKLLST